jgi:hypothetical protein
MDSRNRHAFRRNRCRVKRSCRTILAYWQLRRLQHVTRRPRTRVPLIHALRFGKIQNALMNQSPCSLPSRWIDFSVRIQTLSIIFTLVFMAVCVSTGQTPSGGESGIEGTINISPARPGPIRAGEPASVPLANATFVVENNQGEVASFTTDDKGHFKASLLPGHYKVSLKGRKSSIGRFGPFEVDVASGKLTNVQWECDSGIR